MVDLAPGYKEMLRRHLEAETVFDMEQTLSTLTEDCVFEDMPSGETFQGKDAVRAYYSEW